MFRPTLEFGHQCHKDPRNRRNNTSPRRRVKLNNIFLEADRSSVVDLGAAR